MIGFPLRSLVNHVDSSAVLATVNNEDNLTSVLFNVAMVTGLVEGSNTHLPANQKRVFIQTTVLELYFCRDALASKLLSPNARNIKKFFFPHGVEP